MGIDIYANWTNQTDAELKSQRAAWSSTAAGAKGYLRESYHGSPYPSAFLCTEAFSKPYKAAIPASILRERLPQTLVLAEERCRRIYKSSDAETELVKKSYSDFVSLCEQKEKETGEPVFIHAWY